MSVAGDLKIEGTGLQSFVTLNDGHKMPMFGLGTFESKTDEETENAVVSALKNGYRMVDTAAWYKYVSMEHCLYCFYMFYDRIESKG